MRQALNAPVSEQKSVGIWIRVSTEDQARGESPEHHEQRARAYADLKGWQVREVYRLEAVSGKSVMAHPEAKRMLEDVRSGHVTGLIFSKLARLARNTKELLEFADYFRDHNADLVSLQESIDTSSPAGRLLYTVISALAEWERAEIASRVAASVPIRARLGKPIGGKPVYGYQWKDRKLLPEPNEAPVRRHIYELFMKLRRVKSVARTLNEEGHRTRNGSKFTDTTVKRLIEDPTAKGLRRANYTVQRADRKRWQFKPESEWIVTPCEGIVSEDLWNACNALLEEQYLSKKPRTRQPVHIFGGVTYCHCGAKMHAKSDKGKYICSSCRTKIPMTDLEAVFREQLHALTSEPAQIASYAMQANQALKEQEELLQARDAEVKTVMAEMDRMHDIHREGGISIDDFGRRYRPLEERLAQIEKEIPRLQAELDVLKIHYLSRDEVLSEASDLYARWSSLPHEEKRSIVEAVVDKVVISHDAIEVNLCHIMPPEIAGRGQRSMARP